jgi:hypothetical protein
MEWQPIEAFDPARNRSSYLFAAFSNIFLGHWYEGEDEPRMAYTGETFPLMPTHFMPLPQPPRQ